MFPLSDNLKLQKFPYLNYLMIGIMLFVFYIQLTAPDQNAFLQTYSLIPAKVTFSDPVTLLPFITAIFLHGGFLHILSNLWFLWIFGDNIEDTLGRFMYLFIFFSAGIIGNIAQYISSPTSSIPALGASGAIAGILGAYYILFPFAKIKTFIPFFIFPFIVQISAPIILGYWFVLQLLSGLEAQQFNNMQGGVAFWAHVAGFIVGFLIVKILGVTIIREEPWVI